MMAKKERAKLRFEIDLDTKMQSKPSLWDINNIRKTSSYLFQADFFLFQARKWGLLYVNKEKI